jgi:hypothetical protein
LRVESEFGFEAYSKIKEFKEWLRGQANADIIQAYLGDRQGLWRFLAMHPIQVEIYKKMSPEEKLRIADRLYWTAYELKMSGLKKDHPDWSDEKLRRKVREAFLYAKS